MEKTDTLATEITTFDEAEDYRQRYLEKRRLASCHAS
jgi:peptide methionine sulfoxide reductase MsrA